MEIRLQLPNTVLPTVLLNMHLRIQTFVPLLVLIHTSKIQLLTNAFFNVQNRLFNITK